MEISLNRQAQRPMRLREFGEPEVAKLLFKPNHQPEKHVVFLPAGQITVEGPFYDNGTDSMFAITGGTGAYQEACGQMRLHAIGHPLGSEYDLIYMLTN